MNADNQTINADGFGDQMPKKTANQLYKESGSKVPFKEWLTEMQEKGFLHAGGDGSGGGGGAAGAEAGSTADDDKKKKPLDIKSIIDIVGQVAAVGTDIGLKVKAAKDAKNQNQQDSQLSHIKDANLNVPSHSNQNAASVGGVPSFVWYSLGFVVIAGVVFYAYKTWGTSDSSATAAPATT